MATLSALCSEALEAKPVSSLGMQGLYLTGDDMDTVVRRLAARSLAMPRRQAVRSLLSEQI